MNAAAHERHPPAAVSVYFCHENRHDAEGPQAYRMKMAEPFSY